MILLRTRCLFLGRPYYEQQLWFMIYYTPIFSLLVLSCINISEHQGIL